MTAESDTTLNAVLVSRARESHAHRFLLRPEQDTADTSAQEITYGIFDAHVSRLARAWMTMQTNGELEGTRIFPKAIIGVFFSSGYTICAVQFALMRLGAVPFCLSPRNSDEALRHLIRKGDIVAIVAATDGGLATRMRTLLQDEQELRVPILEVARDDVADLPNGPELSKTSYPSLPTGIISGQDVAIMQHTSGSTAFPKPVPLSNDLLLRSLKGGTWWVEGLHTQSDIALGQPPIFHMFGLIGGLLNSLYRGHTFAIPPLPPTDNGGLFPSAHTLREYALRIHATEFFGVSSTVVGLARYEGGLDLFKTMKRVLVAGAPMPRENGDWIVQHGVHLVEGVGSTEGGSLFHSNRPVSDPAWQGMRVCWNVEHHFEPFGSPPHTLYEFILHSSPLSGQFPGSDPKTGHFNSHDLFQEWPHPGSGTWRHCGRSDDVLLLSSGQNWNPRPMELQIEGSPAVQHAVIFGHARPYLGVLVAPRGPSGPGSIASKLGPEEKEAVWAAVQVANAIAPSNARIARTCVLLVTAEGITSLDSYSDDAVLGPVKHIPIADKGTPLRPKTYASFKEEIDTVYKGAF